MTAQVRTENYRGHVEKTVQVTCSDPTRPSVTLRVKANIVGSVDILPTAFLGFPRPPNWDYDGKLLIRKEKSETGELKIADVTTSVPWLNARARRLDQPEPEASGLPPALVGDWVLDVTFSDDAPKGQSGQQVRFKTGLPREPEVSIPVSVALQQAVQAIPPSVSLVMPAGAREAKGSLGLTIRPGLGKQAVTATASPESFAVTIERDGERRYKSTVLWKGGENAQRNGNVVISVGGESLTVPVRVVEKPANPAQLGNPAQPANPAQPGAPVSPAGPAAPGGAGAPAAPTGQPTSR